MSNANVGVTFSGNAGQLQAQYQKLLNMQQQMQGQMGQTAKQSKEHHDAAMHYAKEQIGELTGMAMGLVSAGKAVEAITEGYHEWHAETRALASELRIVNQEVLKGIAISGQAKNAPEILAGLKNIPGMTRKEAGEVYAGVHEGAPLETNPKRLLSMVKAAGQVKSLGVGVEGEDFGKFTGMLSELMPGKAADLADMAWTARTKLGRNYESFKSRRQFPNLRALTDLGIFGSPEESLGFAIQGADQSPEMAGKIKEAVEKNYEKPRGIAGHSAHGKGLTALSKAKTPAERWEVIRGNPNAAAAVGLEGLQRFDWESAGRITEDLRGSRGAISRDREQIAGTREGRGLQAERGLDVQLEESKEARGETGTSEVRAQKILDTSLNGSNWFNSLVTKSAYSGLTTFGRGLHGIQHSSGPREGDADVFAGALRAIDPDLMHKYVGAENTEAGYEKLNPQTGLLTEQGAIEELKKIREELERTRAESREGSPRGGPASVTSHNER